MVRKSSLPAMSAVEQQVAALQTELAQSQQHVARLAAAIDALRNESSQAVSDLRRQLVLAQQVDPREDQRAGKGKKIINIKNFEPKSFGGKDEENYKEWAKSVKNFLNVQQRGFRKVLESAEEQTKPIDADDVELMSWENAAEADEALYDYLSMVTTGKALTLVEQAREKGFEAWRLLAHRYNPMGGQLELTKMQHLLHKSAVKSLSELPAAVDAFEKEIDMYNRRNPNNFPEEWKLPILLELIPTSHKRELTTKYTLGERNYKKMRDAIVEFANESRVLKQNQTHRGAADMDVDAMEPVRAEAPADYTEEEYHQYHTHLENELYYMGQKGKGKGAWGAWYGKGGKGGKSGKGGWYGKGAGGGKGGARDMKDVICFWCQKPGHVKRDCKAFAAGKPKVPPKRDAASLESQQRPNTDWEEELDEEAGSLEPALSMELEDLDKLLEQSQRMEAMRMRRVARCERRGCEAKFFPVAVLDESDSDDSDSEDDECPTDFLEASDDEVEKDRVPKAKKKMDTIRKSAENKEFASPSSVKHGESLGDIIAREQKELKEKHAQIMTPPGLGKTPTPREVESGEPSESPLTSCVAKLHEDVDEANDGKRKKKNRNKSAKKKLIRILDEVEEDIAASNAKTEMEVQTDISLPHTWRDVTWTPSGLDTVFDGEYEDVEDEAGSTEDDSFERVGETKQGISVGTKAGDLDNIEQEVTTEARVSTTASSTSTTADGDKSKVMIIVMFTMIMMMMMMMIIMMKPDEELNVFGDEGRSRVEQPRKRRMRLRKGITVDSGAANPVMPRRMIKDVSKITPSEASKLGVHYVAANNGRIRNEGETQFKFKTNEGHVHDWKFQIAEVNKALAAISYMVDEGHRVIFDKDLKTGKDMSLMQNKATGQISRFRRERNVWVIDAMVDESDVPDAHFHRHA